MRYYNFSETQKVGKRGVRDVVSALKKRNILKDFITINRQNNRLCGFDVEVLIESKNKGKKIYNSYSLEVKSDRHYVDNFFIEIISQKESNKLGGFVTTKSDYLMYYFLKQRRLYIFETKKLKKWIEDNKFVYQQRSVRTPTGDSHYTTVGITVPVEDLKDYAITIDEFFSEIGGK